MIKRTIGALVSGILLLAGGASAETVSWPGGNCHAVQDPIGVNGSTGVYFWAGDFGTRSTTTTLYAYCPVETSSAAPVVKSVKVAFVDLNPNENASCRFNTQWFNSSGTMIWFQTAAMVSSGSPPYPEEKTATANFGALGQNANFNCQIPKAVGNKSSTLFRYEITR